MFLVLPIVLVLMFHHITLCETISCMDSGIFGESSAMISFESENTDINTFSNIAKNTGTFAVFADYETEEDTVIRAIYFNDKYVNLPMKEGRFFKSSDFTKDTYTAVIGKDLEHKVYKENNKKYIDINENIYEVIGILGYENKTLFDRYIFINGITMSSIFNSKIYTLDIHKADNCEAFVNNIMENFNSNGINCELLTRTDNFSNKFLPQLLYSRLFISILIINSICLLLISMQWINNQKRNYCIKRLLGASNLKVFLSLFKKYILIILVSCLSGYTYCMFFYSSYTSSLILGYIILIPLALVFLLISTIAILREPLEEAIK